MKTEMEPNKTFDSKQLLLPEHGRLKKFTIPKRTPDKDFLTDCSANQRDYHEVKERLNQGCFDRECDLGSLWHFDKIEMVHNKDLEEEFVAKRTKMREQGRLDKELSSFLVVSKDEVLKICQSGLRTANSTKKELGIMRELGNPQLGVYLFRHVDIALNYASKHSVPVENIIIFRVLLGKVKKIQPPKGKKKVALDPTPNYDCHVSRIHPSLKDSIEDQAIGSLIYFYEYSELSKPVERPRQCLPHAVVKVQSINQKGRADHPVISLKCGPKKFFKGRGRGRLLENCTVVTRIGNSKLVYEHFPKPKNCAVSETVPAELSSLPERAPAWNCSGAETQGGQIKYQLPGQWDSAHVEAGVQNFKCMPDVDCNRGAQSDQVGSYSKNPNDASVHYGELSTTITSKLIKDPRLMKRGRNPWEQNGEPASRGILQSENELKYQTEVKMSATSGMPWPRPEELFLLNDSWHVDSEKQYMAEAPGKVRVAGDLVSNDECSANNERTIVNVNQRNREILDSQDTDTDLAVKSNQSRSSLKTVDCEIKTAGQIFAGRNEKVKYSKPVLLGQVENGVRTNSVNSAHGGNGICTRSKEQLVLAPPVQISACIHNLERVAADKDELDCREGMYSQFPEDDGYSSEVQRPASLDSKCSTDCCISEGDGETLQSRVHGRMHFSESPVRDIWTEDSNVCEQPAETARSGKYVTNEKTNRPILSSSERASKSIGEMEENTSKKTNRPVLSSSERASKSIGEMEENTSKKTNRPILSSSERASKSIGEMEENTSKKTNRPVLSSSERASKSIGEMEENTSKKTNRPVLSSSERASKSIGEMEENTSKKTNRPVLSSSERASKSIGEMEENTSKKTNRPVLSSSERASKSIGEMEENTSKKTNRPVLSSSERASKSIGEMEENTSKKTNRPILSSSERASKSIGEMEENTSKTLEECIDVIKDWLDTSHISDSENSAFDFNLNFQDKRSFTESQLTKIENGEEKRRDLSDLALLAKFTGLTTEDMLLSSPQVLLRCVKDTEVKHPQFENTSHSKNENLGTLNFSLPHNSIPEIFELSVGCTNINTPDLDVNSETEILSEEYKNLSSPTAVSNEEADFEYQYLQERIDWENLLAAPSSDTGISRSISRKEDKNECSCEGKREVGGKETKMFNTHVRPDLEITVANMLGPHPSSLKTRMGTGELVTKCSEPKKAIKSSLEKKNKKRTLSQKNSSTYRQKKVVNSPCSSERTLPLSKGQSETFEQSEKNIKNILHALNTEASLCKNKHLSRKINGAVFHLKEAQRSVQNYFKILAQTAKKKRNVSGSHKIVLGNLTESSDRASCDVWSVQKTAACFTERKSPKVSTLTSPVEMREAGETTNIKVESHIESKGDMIYNTTSFLNDNDSGGLRLDCSVTSAFISDGPCSRDNVRVRVIDHELSEKKPTRSDIEQLGDTETDSSESRGNSEQRAHTNVVSENNIQGHFSPIMGSTKQELSSETDKSPVTSKNISKHLNAAIGTEELSISYADLGTDGVVCESNVKASTARLAPPVEKTSGKLKPSKPSDLSKLPLLSSGKDTFSNEKETGEISPAQQNNAIMSIDRAQACDVSRGLAPVVKSRHDARDPQILLAPQMHGSSSRTKIDKSPERNLEKICPEKQVERQELCENKKFKLLAEPIVQLENSVDQPRGHVAQKSQVPCRKESANRQPFPASNEKVIKCHSVSPLRGNSKQGSITVTKTSPCACENVLPKDRGPSGEHSINCKDITSDTRVSVEVEPTALDFIMQMSEMLRKADETLCLNVLEEQVIVCKNVLPLFVRALEEKQDCSSEQVLVSRENAEKSPRAKLKPCAVEALIELQIIMEILEFIENKKRYLQGRHTFRSLLWFDDSLCTELFGGQSGYQQQSNLYPSFQRSLKYNAFNELQSHHKKLVDKYEITKLENKSYYCLLKLRREIKECEAAVKSNSVLSDFFCSEPYVCGANYGDTITDLENARKKIVDLIKTCSMSGVRQGVCLATEKIEHLEIIMNIISTKMEFIRTCEEGNIKSSFIGLEHIFFNAAVNGIFRESTTGDFNNGEGEKLKIYEAALPTLYKIYEENLERHFNCASEERILRTEKSCSYKEANYDVRNYLVSYPEICIGEILDDAQSVNLDRLLQHQCRCAEQLEVLKKYFQIIQEEDVERVLITRENVLSFMESSGLRAVRLKPEAVEVYTDLAMVHETLCFVQNSIARKEDKPRFRSLLWFDLSLVSELFHCQQKMAPFSYHKDNLLESIESAISDLQDELNVVYDYAESLNCSYARRLLTRELEELLETRKYLQMSVSSVCMCVDVVPYSVSLNYGSNLSELEYNYEQFYSLLEKLLLEEKKDLGKMAQVLKILKTIEHMKFICTKQQKPPLHLVMCQMLKNWRKSRWWKNQGETTRHLDANGSNGMKGKRPPEDDSWGDKNDSSDSKKKKMVVSLTASENKQEKEACRNMRKSERPKAVEEEELQLRIPTDNTWDEKDECLREGPSLSPSYPKGLKAADPLDCIEFPPSVSCPALVNSNTLDSQENPTDLKDFSKDWDSCSEEDDPDCFASCDERGKVLSISPNRDPSPQHSPEDSFTSVVKLNGGRSPPTPLHQFHDLKPDVTGGASGVIPGCCTAIPLELGRSGERYEQKSVANHAPACNPDSSIIPELNTFREPESSPSDPFPTENPQSSAQCSAFGQNERVEETPYLHSYSVHTYRTVCPSYSWLFYQSGSSCHQITQTYQEFSSSEMHPLAPAMFTATSMVFNTQSSTFYTQSYSHWGVGESQRFSFGQTYPVQSYFSSTASFPYSCPQWPSWYAESPAAAQASYPYSSDIGL